MSDPSQQGMSSGQLASMQQSAAGAGQGGLFGLQDTQGIFAPLNSGWGNLFESNLGIFGKPPQASQEWNRVVNLDGFHSAGTAKVYGNAGDLRPPTHADVYGTASSGSTDGGGNSGGGDDVLGRLRPMVLVYGQNLHGAGAFYMDALYGGATVSAPSTGRGMGVGRGAGMGM